MHFKLNQIIFSITAASIVSGSPIPDSNPDTSISCLSDQHPCQSFPRFAQCSPAWISSITRCMNTGCINWFQNPLNQCKGNTPDPSAAVSPFGCKVRASACRIPIPAKLCTAEWRTQVLSCMPISCVQDDLVACETENTPTNSVIVKKDDSSDQMSDLVCKFRARSCRFQILAPICSTEWKKQITSCMPMSCIADDLKACDNQVQPPVDAPAKRQDSDPAYQEGSLACKLKANACRIHIIKAGRCSAEWRKEVLDCMPIWCVSSQLVECDAQTQSQPPQ